MHLEWSNLRDLHDIEGRPLPNPLGWERLCAAVEQTLRKATPSLFDKALGTRVSRRVPIRIRLFQEGCYQWVFRVTVPVRGTRRQLALIVSKDSDQRARAARREYDLLRKYHARCPRGVVEPLASAWFPLIDDSPSKLFGYCTPWLANSAEVNINFRGRLLLNTMRKLWPLERRASDQLKIAMAAVWVALYQPRSHTAPVLPEIASGDFVARPVSHWKRPGKLSPIMIACRDQYRKMPPAEMVNQLVWACWDWVEDTVWFLPRRTQAVIDAVCRGAALVNSDPAAAHRWAVKTLRQYAGELCADRFEVPDWFETHRLEHWLEKHS